MSALISDFDAPLPGPLYWDASFLVHATYPAGRYYRECYAFEGSGKSTVKTPKLSSPIWENLERW
jgi:hypothetical protein